ncbi:MAG TPA: S41 family peptidase, partial [Fimbriimonas sp.]
IRKEVREKTERDLLPQKARQRLLIGKGENVVVVWTRNGSNRTTTLRKAESRMPGLSSNGDAIRLQFVAGAADWLEKQIEGKKQVTIDLTNNPLGDFGEMKRSLAVLAPTGTYGTLKTSRTDKAATPLAVSDGNASPPKITLKVDGSTRGAAQIFALALKSKNLAALQGTMPTSDTKVYEVTRLPDGSGYTLVTSEYKATAPARTAKRPS